MEATKAKLVLVFLISLQFCSLSISIPNPRDFLALQFIRKSLADSPGSHFFDTWDFTADPCSFPGVRCDTDVVVSIDLGSPVAGSPGLTGRIHPAIGNLSALTEFTIVPGRVMGRIPDSVSELTALRFFSVRGNYLSGEIPAGLGRSAGLQSLDLSYNRLTGSIPEPVSSLPTLNNLILSHNHLTGPVPCFKSGSLARVDLAHNNLSGSLSPDSFPPSLTYLSLASNRLEGPVDRVLTSMPILIYLDLSVNRFTGIIPQQIFGFPLSTLLLQRNMFSGRVHPEEQVAIATVDLSYNRLYGEISPMLSSVKNLYLNSNKFMGRVPAIFVYRLLDSTIQVLYLHHNYLTGVNQFKTAVRFPLMSSVCLLYNCMVPPIDASSCPFNAGTVEMRPATQCIQWRG